MATSKEQSADPGIGCDKKGESPQPLMLSPIPDDGIAAREKAPMIQGKRR